MTSTKSFVGRRQFIMAAGVASLSAFGICRSEAFSAPAGSGMAVASEKITIEGIEKMNVSEKFRMPQWVIDEVLSPGYGPREIGYEQLENGDTLPDWLTFDPATLTFSGIPDSADVGSLGLRVEATDNGGLSVSDSFTLTVDYHNDAPELETIENL